MLHGQSKAVMRKYLLQCDCNRTQHRASKEGAGCTLGKFVIELQDVSYGYGSDMVLPQRLQWSVWRRKQRLRPMCR